MTSIQQDQHWYCVETNLNRYKRTISVTNLLNHLEWTSLQRRWKIARLTMMYKITNSMVQVDFGRLHKTPGAKIRSTKKERQTSTLKTTCSSSVPKRLLQILIPATTHPGLEWFTDWSCRWSHVSWRFHVRSSQAPPEGLFFFFLAPTPPPPPPLSQFPSPRYQCQNNQPIDWGHSTDEDEEPGRAWWETRHRIIIRVLSEC